MYFLAFLCNVCNLFYLYIHKLLEPSVAADSCNSGAIGFGTAPHSLGMPQNQKIQSHLTSFSLSSTTYLLLQVTEEEGNKEGSEQTWCLLNLSTKENLNDISNEEEKDPPCLVCAEYFSPCSSSCLIFSHLHSDRDQRLLSKYSLH